MAETRLEGHGMHVEEREFRAEKREDTCREMRRYVATIGFFDGVHRGHQYLIGQLRREASALGLGSMLVTFDRHPRQVLHADYVPSLLSTLDEKVELLRQTQVDEVHVLHFTPEMASMDAQQFMREVLADELHVAVLLMGYDHRFGRGGGTFPEYCAWGREAGIQVMLASALPGEKVSSSVIRRLLSQGDVTGADELLGRPYRLTGMVRGGHRVGRLLGFPTANISLPAGKLIPAGGVYAVRVQLPDGEWRAGMLNIGHRPTLHNGENVSVEVNILDFEGDLYNKEISVDFVGRLRDEQAFPSLDDLRRQLSRDKMEVRKLTEGM